MLTFLVILAVIVVVIYFAVKDDSPKIDRSTASALNEWADSLDAKKDAEFSIRKKYPQCEVDAINMVVAAILEKEREVSYFRVSELDKYSLHDVIIALKLNIAYKLSRSSQEELVAELVKTTIGASTFLYHNLIPDDIADILDDIEDISDRRTKFNRISDELLIIDNRKTEFWKDLLTIGDFADFVQRQDRDSLDYWELIYRRLDLID